MSYVLLFTVFCVASIHLTKQDRGCVPAAVTNLVLNGNDTLTWENSPDETCEINFYMAYITTADGTSQFTYMALTPIVQLDRLERCEGYTFRVFPVSTDNVLGPEVAIYSVTPPASDANLALEYLTLTQEGKNVRLQWALEDQYVRCARRYRVVVYNEDSDEAEDIYTTLTSLIVNDIVPCGRYTFAVRALFTLEEEGPTTLVSHVADDDVTDAPRLADLTVDETSFSFTWDLEEYSKNRCPISKLIITGYPNVNVEYSIPNQANRTPLSLSLTGLSSDTMYYLRVVANNTAGPSEVCQLGVQTLPSS